MKTQNILVRHAALVAACGIATAALAQAQSQQTAKTDTAKSVADLSAQAEVVRQKAPEDAALVQAAQTLAQRSQQLQAELAETQKLVAEMEQGAKTAADVLAATRAAVDQAQAGLAAAQTKQNELDAAKTVRFDFYNTQMQQKFVWPPSFALAKAYLDQLERSNGLAAEKIQATPTRSPSRTSTATSTRRPAPSSRAWGR